MSHTHEQLSDLCEAIVDCPHSTPVWTNTGYVVLRNQNIRDGRLDLSQPSYTDEKHFLQRIRRLAPQPGDIVITREAPMGEVCKIPDGLTCCLGQRQVLLRPKNTVDPNYLLYALQSPHVKEQISWNEGTGSTVSNIRIPVLSAIKIPRHGEREEKIAEVLALLDGKIDLNQQTNQTLEATAQAIFKSWFVDFEPVKAKIAAIEQGQDPLRAAMRALSGKTDAELEQMPGEQYDPLAATAALFPEEMQPSKPGEIPRGWNPCTLGDLVDLNPKEKLPKGTVAPYIDMASLSTSGSWSEAPVLREMGSGTKFRNKDVLLARITPCLENGKTAYIQNLPGETIGWGSTEFIVMRARNAVPPAFPYILARSENFRTFAIQSMTGTSGRQRAQAKVIAEYSLADPGTQIWHAFNETMTPFFEEIRSRSEEIVSLSELRDTLLPKLLSGELQVPIGKQETETRA
ncbi:restriction endonuclease subunit S [Microbulbifer sp.]|uniref:restriction endonuclease subunit S n=1 Tax=Microbulbifer sp. TaxID=1908541 RepID=UPI003F2DFC9B